MGGRLGQANRTDSRWQILTTALASSLPHVASTMEIGALVLPSATHEFRPTSGNNKKHSHTEERECQRASKTRSLREDRAAQKARLRFSVGPTHERPIMTPREHPATLDESLRQALDHVPLAIAVYTAESWVIASMIVYVNDAYSELCGYPVESIVGHSALLLGGARPDAEIMRSILPAQPELGHTVTVAKERTDGSVYQVRVGVSPLRNGRGEVTHYVAVERLVEAPSAVVGELLRRVRPGRRGCFPVRPRHGTAGRKKMALE